MRAPFSIVILTFNEEENIGKALETSCAVADEVVVLDSFSTDRTLDIARSFPCRVEQRPFDDFSSQKNAAIALATHDWVFVLDADEYLEPPLQAALVALFQGDPDADVYACYRVNMMWGSPSGRPEVQYRLINKSLGIRYKGQRVHEAFDLTGRSIAFLTGNIRHEPIVTLSRMLEKANHYTSLEALDCVQLQKRYIVGRLLLYPFYHFLKEYIRNQRCREGIKGFIYSLFAMYYQFLKYAKTLERSRQWATEQVAVAAKKEGVAQRRPQR